MDNQETPQKGIENSVGSESSTPAFSQIKYEFSDSATAKPAAKPSGAYNTNYYAAKNAAKVTTEEMFCFTPVNVHFKSHHKELKDKLLPIMFFSTLGDTSELYNDDHTVTQAAWVLYSGQEDVPLCDSIGLEQFELCGSIPDSDHSTDVQLGVCYKDVCLVLFCKRCSKWIGDGQLCPDCMGPVSIRHFRR